MATIARYAYVKDSIVPYTNASLSIGSSAVLYGLSVYTVVHIASLQTKYLVFRLSDHVTRLLQSARIIGFTNPELICHETNITAILSGLLKKNSPTHNQFCRITLHVAEEVPGVKTSELALTLSVFMYDALPILPQHGARLKTSYWRRVSDNAIPARAKVNGAYVNSALAKQDAINSGYDDCMFLNQTGFISELSAANILFIKNGTIITPDTASDILEGITRKTILELATVFDYQVQERKVSLSEAYSADEAFACGTSAFVSQITSIDERAYTSNTHTKQFQSKLTQLQTTENDLTTVITI